MDSLYCTFREDTAAAAIQDTAKASGEDPKVTEEVAVAVGISSKTLEAVLGETKEIGAIQVRQSRGSPTATCFF